MEVLNEQLASLPYGKDEKYSQLYYILLQASLFSEIGIPTRELLEYLRISRPTLQKRLNDIDKHNLLITERRDSNKFYQLKLETIMRMTRN